MSEGHRYLCYPCLPAGEVLSGNGEGEVCPTCGSEHLISFPTWECACGWWAIRDEQAREVHAAECAVAGVVS